MQADITFSGDVMRTKTADHLKIFQTAKSIQGLQQFADGSYWPDRLLRYEKHINLFCWVAIVASVIYLTPICVDILVR